MTTRVLSTRTLNRTLLDRQLLLERSGLGLVPALERIGGLQMQYAPSGYIGLWSRVRDFQRDALTRALEQRRVIQATLMRSTIHLVSTRDYVVMTEGVRRHRREWWERVARHEGIDVEAVVAQIRELLADGPVRAPELIKGLEGQGGRDAWAGANVWLDLMRVPPSGTWERRRADLYGLADDWIDDRESVTEHQGIEHLVRSYLRGFGPAAVADIANWAGVPPAAVHDAVAQMDLREFRSESGGELLDLPRLRIADADTPAPVRFLPTWDATLLVHARRALILPEEYRPRVFSTKTPQSVPTFLVDGAVAGTWRYDGERVTVEPFAPLPKGVRRELDDEAARLAAFHAD